MPAFRLACLAYFSVALPGSTLGLLWPSIRLSYHEPVAALGVLLIFGVTASVISSAVTGRLLSRRPAGSALALGTMLTAVALVSEALSPALWMFGVGMVVFGLGFGAIDTALNVHAAHHFDARQINWMHAAYGVGATVGPLLATALLSEDVTWRWVSGIFGIAQAAVAVAFAMTGSAWVGDRPARPQSPPPQSPPPIEDSCDVTARPARRRRPSALVVLGSLTFTAVETGVEDCVGVWSFVFLTDGRGLNHAVAGVGVSAYWAMMFVGRVVLGPIARRAGARRVLGAAVAGVSAGAVFMVAPGPAPLAVVGLLVLGVAAAPVFPLFTLTTAQRIGDADDTQTSRTVGLQVAASAVGGAVLPAGLGVCMAALTARAFAPPLLILSVGMAVVYGLLSRSASDSGVRVES